MTNPFSNVFAMMKLNGRREEEMKNIKRGKGNTRRLEFVKREEKL